MLGKPASGFQSLFWWKSQFKRDLDERCCTECLEFQSLFWWKSQFKHRYKFMLRKAGAVSFNPCFGGSHNSNLEPYAGDVNGEDVSILVLVEVTIQTNREDLESIEALLFQSLFWWKSQFKHKMTSFYNNLRFQFQSLFWWKSQFKHMVDDPATTTTILFQSLFWWKSQFKLLKIILNTKLQLRFNPCFGGSHNSNGAITIKWWSPGSLFQSLFWWKSQFKLTKYQV